MKQIWGESWKTSLVGALLAGLMVLQEYLEKDEVSYTKIGIAVMIAILGRVAADGTKEGDE